MPSPQRIVCPYEGFPITCLPPLTGEAAKTKFLTEGFYHFKQKRQRGNPLTLLPFVKKTTTGYAGGHKEFHLWIEKENLQ